MVNVVIGVIEKDEKILLIQRERGDFVGLWGLPGGKVEECEHLDKAIQREMLEELGIEMEFRGILGISTEIMHDKSATSLLYVCLLRMKEEKKITNPEFKYEWFTKEELENKQNIIESDKLFIKEFYNKRDKNYLKLDCYRDEKGNYYWD